MAVTESSGNGYALYNGLKLPNIDSVWTDKGTYPYAHIIQFDDAYGLVISTHPALFRTRGDYTADYLPDGAACMLYMHTGTEWYFMSSKTISSPSGGYDELNYTKGLVIIWANYDVYRSTDSDFAENDGSLYLAASDPVPVGGVQETAVVTETSGDGYALYNGVKLPNIDSVWDKTKYPYVLIGSIDYSAYGIDALLMFLIPASVPFGCVDNDDGNPSFFATADGVGQLWITGDEASFNALGISGATPGVWGLDQDAQSFSGSSQSPIVSGNAVWSSYDIESGDVGDSGFVSNNTTYLAASDPIPLDGMTVIEWNGVTTGLAAGTYVADVNDGITFNLYRVSDYTPIQAGDVLAVKFGSDYGGAVIENDDNFAEFGTDGNCYSYFIASASAGEYTANVGAHTATITLPTDGLYMYSGYGGEGQVTLYAYPNTSADLKPVYLRINGAWVKQTAYQMQNGEWVRISTAEKAETEETATMLYNGVELPSLPEWDKTTYPYAAIVEDRNSLGTYLDTYLVCTQTVVSYNGSCFVTDMGGTSDLHTFSLDGSAWKDRGHYYMGLGAVSDASTSTWIWTNTDILNADGSVYLAASDPEPV